MLRFSCALGAALVFAAGCGARTGTIDDDAEIGMRPIPHPEVCNGLDDDLDGLVAVGALDGAVRVFDGAVRGFDGSVPDAGARDGGVRDGGVCPDGGRGCDLDLRVDEDFRDSIGRYVHDQHCGECGHACRVADLPHSLAVGCGIVEESPLCVARRCEAGFTPSRTGRCVPIDRLCLPCADDGDCGDFEGAICANVGGERRCAIDCELGCPDGYGCAAGICAPLGGSCTCDRGDSFSLACALEDPDGDLCPGSARCDDGTLSECAAPAEVCDEVDNDCDGDVDDGFRDARGAYIVDIHNCGECGVDCTLSTVPEGDLVCGGDPFAPSCVLHCPDTDDGIQPGDRVDADRNIATGCECVVSSLADPPGPVRTSGSMLDVNCDGADGIVVGSLYVATDGDDAGPGSPTRPMRTIDAALRRASDSRGTAAPRIHVFVAVGVYTETLHLLDGVQLHGGYRRDFLALDPDGFRVEVRAPTSTTAPGGAAIEIRGAGGSETVVEWIAARGVDADAPGEAAFGIYALDPGPRLAIRDMEVRAGVPGSGAPGANGRSGASPTTAPAAGDPPRGAIEDASHTCLTGDARNVVAGGRGGQSTCGTVGTAGGDGGAPRCPVSIGSFQADGATGSSAGAATGGAGGRGGQDSQGPITSDSGACPTDVCCGLADFTVTGEFTGPQPGRAGGSGRDGTAGGACGEAFGRFDSDRWIGMDATGGSSGSPGSGGGGGGAGGGTIMDWFPGECEFADGLGGGGGGGGAGGCGGDPGVGGTSGAPSVAILVRYTIPPIGIPAIERVTIVPSDGGGGGDGGAGGDGGRGANGAFGGSLPRSARTTPTLAGPFGGARGGQGGNGGAGGGGGGGCGGGSIGIWITGVMREPGGVGAWRSGNTFRLGRGGLAGRGGGGAAAGMNGAAGGAMDVFVR